MPAEIQENGRTKDWFGSLAVYRHPRVIAMLFLGFSAGLPFMLIFATLAIWLREADVSVKVIGFFSWVGITFSIKFIWAPVVDSLGLPLVTSLLGRRRSWMLIAQLGIALGLLAISLCDPRGQIILIAVVAVVIAFGSATQSPMTYTVQDS